MPPQELVSWDRAFEKQVEVVVEKHRAISARVERTKEALIDFYGAYYHAYQGARQLGNDAVNYLHEQMGLDAKSRASLSEYRDIGEAAPMLQRYIKKLPAAQDALKLLARVEAPKLAKWVKDGDVYPSMTTAEARLLTHQKRRSSKGAPKTAVPNYRVVLTSQSKAELVTAVAAILRDTADVSATCDRPIHASVKGALGKAWWKTNEEANRLIDASKKQA